MMITQRAAATVWAPTVVLLSCFAPLVGRATAQGGRGLTGQARQNAREAMWPAPTAEDWKKPVLIQFQRTWEDALAVAKETGKPILICVNMDGEIASEHYAGIRYRQPEKTKLYEPYVNVIASVYRHTPRDFDENGKRIPCPRFGGVTCGEHIAIEPVLYEKFFDGVRVAPRHIMVELDGKESYDVYYAWDTDSVFKAIRDGIANRPIQPKPIVRGDRTIVERVASRDSKDRNAVEQAFAKGDAALRERLIRAALANTKAAPDGLLRLAVFGLDPKAAQIAREALAKAESTGSVDVINEALRVPMKAEERKALVAALTRLGKKSRRARTLSVVHRGLVTKSSAVDIDGWSKNLVGAEYPAPKDWNTLESTVAAKDEATRSRPKDAKSQLELAEASLALGRDPKTGSTRAAGLRGKRNYARLVFEDARNAALEAERLGAKGWRLHSTLAIAAKHLGNESEAFARAVAAMRTMPPTETSWRSLETLSLFASARQQAIIEAWRNKQDWPPQWLSDVHSAYAVLSKHPLSEASHALHHYDFLNWLGARGPAERCLRDALAKFPDTWALHDRLRSRILADRGVDALEPAYEKMLRDGKATPSLSWYAGYTSIVAAEFYRRKGSLEKGFAAYDRAVAHYDRAIEANPGCKSTADHYVALAMAGRARIAFQLDDFDKAVAELVASFERKPQAAAVLDGLNVSAVDTAKTVRAKVSQLERGKLVATINQALGKLDPEQLKLPAYEKPARPARQTPQRRGR